MREPFTSLATSSDTDFLYLVILLFRLTNLLGSSILHFSPRSTQNWWLRIPVMSLFHFYSHSFREAIIYLPFFFFLAMEWQLRSPNGSHICCRLHRFVVCLTIFFLFFPPFGSLIFLFIAIRTFAFISHKQTNKHGGGGGVVAKQKYIIFPI
jgi:hypothetical protein